MKKSEKQINLVNDYKTVFNSEKGKIVLYDLMAKCNMLSTSFSGDVNDTIYNEGKRSIMLTILNLIDTDPIALKKLMEETDKENALYDLE